MTRRTQQTSILEFIGTPGRGISRARTQSNRAERINFTARSNTQLQFHGSDEEGDQVDSDGSGHLDTFKLNKKKTRLEDDEHIDVTTQRTAPSQNARKKKVLQDSEDEENDFTASNRPDTLPEAGPSVLRGQGPLRRTPSPATTPPPPSSSKRERNSSSRKRTRFVSSVNRESSPEVLPQDQQPSRQDAAGSYSMRKKSRLERLDPPVAGPSSSPTKRKTRSDGPVSQERPTQESTQEPTQEKISGRTRNRLGEVQKVDYVESDEDELLLIPTRGRRKAQVDEDWDDNVTPSMESVLDIKGKGRAVDTQETQSRGIDSDSSLTSSPEGDTPSRRTRSAVRRSRLARYPPSEPITPTRKNHRVVTKLKIFSSESEMGPESDDPLDDDLSRRTRRLERREEEEEEDASQFPEIRLPARSGNGKKSRKRRRDPDDTDDEEEMIDSKKMLEEIELDEPVVLKNRMRDRTKKSEFQRNLERLKRKKLARSGQPIAQDTESESEQDDDDEEEEEEDEYGDAGQIVIDGSDEDAIRVVDDESDFIVSDAEQLGEFDARMLPAEFRLSSYQDLEHHFKVISQYFTHLVVSGPTVISQSNSHYFKSALEAFRRRFQGTKDSLIASSVWKPGFRKSLETFPEFVVHELDEAVMGCDACHLTGRLSKFEGNLSGREYDSKTFEDLSDDSDTSDSGEEDGSLSKGPFRLGKYCRERAEVFHEFSHWEYELYQAYRIPYRQLLRRTNASLNRDSDDELDSEEEVKEIRPFVSYAGFTQDSIRDGDEVLEYFESMGYIKREWDRLDRMMKHAQKLDSYRR